MNKRSVWRRLLRGMMWLLLGGLLLSLGSVLLMRWVDPVTSTFMMRDRMVVLFSGDKDYRFAHPFVHQWVDHPRISRWMPQAVIAAEDQKFFEHHGFDFESMEKAWSANQRGRRIRGGSTISQQVAKNLFLWPGRSYVRKGLEAYFTVLIEALWPKQRILEMYVNSAEFGEGVFGVQAASQRFFHKNAAQLTSAEAALLAAVLPAPKRLRVDHPSNFVRSRQAWIQQQMAHLDPVQW